MQTEWCNEQNRFIIRASREEVAHILSLTGRCSGRAHDDAPMESAEINRAVYGSIYGTGHFVFGENYRPGNSINGRSGF